MADPRADPLLGFVRGPKILSTQLLPHDALHQCGLCRGNNLSLSVCLSVRPLHASILSKRLNISSQFFHHLVATRSVFFVPNGVAILRRGRLTGRGQQGV